MTLTRTPYRLPQRRKPPKSGIARAPKRVWLRHRKFVRSHECCVPGCPSLETEFAHIRSAATAGTGLKPSDQFGVPLCFNHHREQHQVGQGTFEDRHGIDLVAIAAELVRRSPDVKMRLSLLEATLEPSANPLAVIPIRANPVIPKGVPDPIPAALIEPCDLEAEIVRELRAVAPRPVARVYRGQVAKAQAVALWRGLMAPAEALGFVQITRLGRKVLAKAGDPPPRPRQPIEVWAPVVTRVRVA